MRLAIKNWPPAASHLTCLFLGMFITNLSQKPCKIPNLKKNQVLLSFEKKKLKIPKKYNFKLGSRVLFAKKKLISQEDYCLERHRKLTVVYNKEFLTLETTLSNVHNLFQFFSKKIQLKLLDHSRQDNYPTCAKKTEIKYGL